jgi:hypothetical protein
MKRIVVIADITWAISRVHKDIEEELRNEGSACFAFDKVDKARI